MNTQCSGQTSEIKMDNFTFEGRIKKVNGNTEIYWPGSSMSFIYTGTYIDLILSDNIGESKYSVIINGVEQDEPIIPSTTKGAIRISNTSNQEKNTVTIHRRSDYTKGTTTFYGVATDGEIMPTTPKSKLIEFYGNSITVGYANEDTTAEDNPFYTNNYKAYAALTTQHFDAALSCIARSGIGLTVSWFDLIMPELFDRWNPNLPASKWDFNRKTPDLVVINLLQNDSWIYNNPDNEFYIKRIGRQQPNKDFVIEHYSNFLKEIRNVYPNTSILCVMGSMDIVKKGSPWVEYVMTSIQNLNDENIYAFKMPFLAKTTHPSVEMHKEMSQMLIKFIEKNKLL